MMNSNLFDPRKVIGDTVCELARNDDSIVVVSADSAARTGLGCFRQEFPNRYFEVGIMEQSAVSISAGLATTGKTAIFAAPAPFASGRAYEMVRIDVGYMRQNVKILARNCGINYTNLGPTHYGLDDMALARIIPGMVVIAPQDITEIHGATKAMLEYEGPVYMRFSTAKLPKLFEEGPFTIGKGRLILDGDDVAVISTGETTANVVQAVEKLKKEGIHPMVIGMPTVSPADTELITMAAKKTGKIVTVEEHFVVGGLGSVVADICGEYAPMPIKRLGMPHAYITAGTYDGLIKDAGLDVEGIAASIKAFVQS